MGKEKKLKKNMAFNSINGLLNVIFPLISFPYITRVLYVDSLGAYNYSNSIINYLVILAGLGIAGYAIRTGSAKRNDEAHLNQFVSEMFSISMMTSLVSYLVLFIGLKLLSDALLPYRYLLLIQSVLIVSQAIGISWIYNIFEDFKYVTLKNAIVNFVSMIAILFLVKKPEDIYIYAIIYSGSNFISNLINFIYARKYCKVRFTFRVNMKQHIKPIMYFFATSLSVTIYVNSDVTILGILSGDYYVGLYSVSAKIYSIIKNILSAAITVAIPRMSMYYGRHEFEKMNSTASEVYGVIITSVLPVMTGIFIFSKEIILLVAGDEYVPASNSLVLLGICIICYMFSYFYGQCILVPIGKESIVFWSTLLSAIINIILNFLLIPLFKQDAAAFTSILGEGLAMVVAMWYSRKQILISGKKSVIVKTSIGCLGIMIISFIIKKIINDAVLALLVSVILSAMVYVGIEIIVKNEAIYSIYSSVIKKNKER